MRRKLLILAVSATLVGLVVAFALALPLMGCLLYTSRCV